MTGGARELFEASYLQESLYRAAEGGESAANVGVVLALQGFLDWPRLGKAISGLALRHEALRTTLTSVGGRVQQAVTPSAHVPAIVLDVSAEPAPGAESVRLIREHLRRPFALGGPSLWRAMLVRCGPDRHLLALSLHHAIMDGWSAKVLIEDLRALYGGADDARLAAPALQFADYAAWERETAGSVPLRAWRDRLSGYSTRIRIPGATGPGPEQLAVARELPEAGPGLSDSIQKLARQHRVPVVAVLAAAVAASLREYADDVVATAQGTRRAAPGLIIGLVRANRERAELRDVVGYLADIAPLTIDLRGDPQFGCLVSRAADSLAYSRDHPVPLAALSAVLRTGRREGPLFDVCLNYLPGRLTHDHAAGELRMTSIGVPEIETASHRWWDGTAVITYQLGSGQPRRVSGHVCGDINTISPGTLADLAERFWAALLRGTACPGLPLSDLVPALAGGTT